MTTIRVVLDDRRHTFITETAVEGMLCDNCPQPHPATTEIVDDPSGDSWGTTATSTWPRSWRSSGSCPRGRFPMT